MLNLTTALLSLTAAYVAYLGITLILNIRDAKRIGFPYMVCLFHESLFFIVTQPLVQLEPWIERWLPQDWIDWLWFHSRFKRYNTRNRIHDKYGPVVTLVAPGTRQMYVICADREMGLEIARRGFDKPYAELTVYGPNVVAANGNTWARHRRYTQIPFNERSSALVWKRSLSQASNMISHWTSTSSSASRDSTESPPSITPPWTDGIHRLAFGVFNAAGFGIDLNFDPSDSCTVSTSADDIDAVFSDHAVNPGINRTFRELNVDFDHSLYGVIGSNRLPDWLAKRVLNHAYEVREEMRFYISKVISNARIKAEKGGDKADNLISLLLKSETVAAAAEKDGNADHKSKLTPLTQEEVFGNTWMFSLAGTESTIRLIQFGISLLASHQDVQKWLHDEIDTALEGESEDPNDWTYETFGKLKGPLCIMNETLRLISPAPHNVRITPPTPTTLTFNGKSHVLPPSTHITISTRGLCFNTDLWGPDVDVFDPTRWDPSNKSAYLQRFWDGKEARDNGPTILKPLPGAFPVFSEGMRKCLGMKFATVEFVAVVTTLMRKYRVDAERKEGESVEEARSRAFESTLNGTTQVVQGFKEPFGLVFEERRV